MSIHEALVVVGINLAAIAAGLFLIWIVLRILINTLAEQDLLFTLREEGQFKYVMRGGGLERILYKLQDYQVDEKTGVVEYMKGAGNEQATNVEWFLGATWIGISPLKILEYTVQYDRAPKPEDPRPVEAVQPDPRAPKPQNIPGYDYDDDHNIVHRSTLTTFHLLKEVYPIVAKGVELADRTKVDIFGTFTVQTFNAYTPVLELKGGWFGHIRGAAQGAITDWAQQFTLEQFTSEPKAGNGSGLELAILATRGNGSDTGTRRTTGLGITAFNFEKWRLTPGDPELENASRAEEVAILQGKATIARAKAQSKEITLVGKARAGAALALVEAAGHNELGNRALIAQEFGGAIRGHTGTLVLGNPNTMLSIGDNGTSGQPNITVPPQPTNPDPAASTVEPAPEPAPTPGPVNPAPQQNPPQNPNKSQQGRRGNNRRGGRRNRP